jgi:hypothetical protein
LAHQCNSRLAATAHCCKLATAWQWRQKGRIVGQLLHSACVVTLDSIIRNVSKMPTVASALPGPGDDNTRAVRKRLSETCLVLGPRMHDDRRKGHARPTDDHIIYHVKRGRTRLASASRICILHDQLPAFTSLTRRLCRSYDDGASRIPPTGSIPVWTYSLLQASSEKPLGRRTCSAQHKCEKLFVVTTPPVSTR